MPLSDTACKNAHLNAKAATGKAFSLFDEKGLHLLLKPSTQGWSKYWRLKYRFNGKDCLMSLGVYPDTSLKLAREKRDDVRKQIAEGINPATARKLEKADSIENTFEAISKEFMAANKQRWSEAHYKHIQECFERDVYPWLGNRPLKELSALEVLTTLRRITARGALETAARTK